MAARAAAIVTLRTRPKSTPSSSACWDSPKMTQEKLASTTWSLYMIRCANGHLYTGITTDIDRRFKEHSDNGPKTAKYLRGKGPLTLVYRERVGSHSDALKREIAVKRLTKTQKVALIHFDANDECP
ncbi:GIY-YIG nuclease family protein [Shewanella alkalitolerans]|uniref:GIY-YIG nuclease family protein n=1 Tax=Shewanella alkalitolerans TaxID=2864209 RepID=UPI003D9C9C32